MALHSQPTYPSHRCYVIKLHRDATPASGEIFGRIEHLVSGEAMAFATKETLLALLIQHAGRNQQETTGSSTMQEEPRER